MERGAEADVKPTLIPEIVVLPFLTVSDDELESVDCSEDDHEGEQPSQLPPLSPPWSVHSDEGNPFRCLDVAADEDVVVVSNSTKEPIEVGGTTVSAKPRRKNSLNSTQVENMIAMYMLYKAYIPPDQGEKRKSVAEELNNIGKFTQVFDEKSLSSG